MPYTFKITFPDVQKVTLDRKSTRLNSSHLVISYAVFCLKKKNMRQVCQSCDHSGPQLSTRLGISFEPRTAAIPQDSPTSSQSPSPEASTTNRWRSRSSCGPSMPGRNCSGAEKYRSWLQPLS